MSGEPPLKALLLTIIDNKYPKHLFGLNRVHLRFVYQPISYIYGILTAYKCAGGFLCDSGFCKPESQSRQLWPMW